MRVGVDFDNTIVCYDDVFFTAAQERGLVCDSVAASKRTVRDFLRAEGKENDWVELQGHVYGSLMKNAKPYPGVIEFFKDAQKFKVPLVIVSHKTRHAKRGVQHDLHASARAWLKQHGLTNEIGESLCAAYFEATKALKLQRIEQCSCTHFIDDLPEFLLEPAWPRHVQRILFDPNNTAEDSEHYIRVQTWEQIRTLLLC